MKEAAELSNSPSADYAAWPLESDLFEWHFTFRGPPETPYAEGIYHGRIILPANYPLAPPNFRFTTPNGRFEANREICLSISGHHEETWQPAWGMRTAIVALRSFMETSAAGQLGGLDTTDDTRRRWAKESLGWKCATCGRTNREIMEEAEERSKEVAEAQGGEDKKEVEIPEGLKMGFKDEMVAKSPDEARQEDRETAEIAEGFVQTAPTVEATAHTSSSSAQETTGDVRNRQPRPAQGVPQPTPTAPQPEQRPQQPPPQTPQELLQLRDSDTGVPVWIDRAIVGLVVLLGMLVLKVLFGS